MRIKIVGLQNEKVKLSEYVDIFLFYSDWQL